MFVMRTAVAMMITCVFATTAMSEEFEKVIIPVVAYDVPGAFGSVWNTELWIHNGTNASLDFEHDVLNVQLGCVGIPCQQPAPLASGAATLIEPNIEVLGTTYKAMRMINVRREISNQITFSLRVHDTSRSLLTWGTEILVVRERDLIVGEAVLLGIPVSGPFRQSLRIYAPRRLASDCEVVGVRVFALDTGETLMTLDTILTDSSGLTCEIEGSWPASSEIHNLAELLPPEHPERVGIAITPNTTDLQFWTLVTVTNDETQHVTTIAPGGNVAVNKH
jgi:hypothetical protein